MLDRNHEQLILGHQKDSPRSSCCFCSCFSQFFSIFLTSLKIIFLENPKFFLSIYLFTCLPLSLLLTFLSLSSGPIKSHISHLEWLSRAVEIWVEADNIRDEYLADLRYLLRLKALYGIPTCLFSLISLIAAVSSAVQRRRPSLTKAAAAVKSGWVRAVFTCTVNYAASIAWGIFVYVAVGAATAFGGINAAAVAEVATSVVEVYLMAVLGVALVVSVAEERAGVEAVGAAWGLMKGRRLVGLTLSGVVMVGSSFIGREMEGVMNGGDWGMDGEYGSEWTVRMRYGYMGGLVAMLGWLVLWSYVVLTVLYCECKKRRSNNASGILVEN